MAISTAPVPGVYGSWIPLASTSGSLPWAMANGPPTWAGAVAIGRHYLLPRFTSWHVCGRRLPGCLCPGGCNAGGLACLTSHALPSERYQGDGVFCTRIPHPTRCLFHKYTTSRPVGATLVVARDWAGTRPAPTGAGLTKWTSSALLTPSPSQRGHAGVERKTRS